MRRRNIGIALVLLSGIAAADVSRTSSRNTTLPTNVVIPPEVAAHRIVGPGKRITVPYDGPVTPLDATSAHTIYMNRCVGGCTVTGGANDARAMMSPIAAPGANAISEFENDAGLTGSAADPYWNLLVTCMQEVYSPFDVTVTDVLPTGGQTFTEIIVAGLPTDIGLDNSILGVATATCSPLDNVLSFSFANHESGSGMTRLYDTCWTAAQETAHNFGLEHEYVFTDGDSACSDPMTYREDCGGEKFFRNKPAQCGEYATRACLCGGTQNSVAKLSQALGSGTSIIPAPTVSVQAPATGDQVSSGFTVHAMAGSRRGVEHLDLYLNGHMWATTVGAAFGIEGQTNPSNYTLIAPSAVPNGVIDVVVKAYDDLEIETDSTTATVTMGAPCTDATTCAKGQKCSAGKCFWDAPVGVLGDSCTFDEYCVSGVCTDSDVGQYCTQSCVVGSTDGCPAMFDCIATSDAQGVCLPQGKSSGGCCSVGPESSSALFAQVGLGAFVLGLMFRRRRRH